MRDSFCSYCGHPFGATSAYPKQCGSCGRKTYRNPIPVAVVLLPVGDGVLALRRGIDPGKGELAFPGGFIELGESWQAAGVREVYEEIGLRVDADRIEELGAMSAPDGTLLVFGQGPAVEADAVRALPLSDEATEIVVLREPVKMAFDLHGLMLRRFLDGRKATREG